ncbi:MAG: DUF7281 domain-containing protein [Gammaproteobacteria bacterium]
MDRKLYQWISELVSAKPDQTSRRQLTHLGREVLTHYGCGYISSNRLIFTPDDKRRLRQRVLAEVGLDPFSTEQLPESRLEMARHHPNEKLAAHPASEDQLLLNSPDGVIRVNGIEIQLHPESITSAGFLCLNSSIETIQHQTIIVVENLAIMPLSHNWRIPCIDRQALWVYRGDYKSGAKAHACRAFVERFAADKTIVVFSDMDPKGLEIALTMPNADYWLGPKEAGWRTCLRSQLANREGFDLQNAALSYLQRLSDEEKLSSSFNELLRCFNEERSSYRQEHMYNQRIELALFSIAEFKG